MSNTTQFGREIKFGDIQKGQTILLYCKTQNTMHKGKVICAEAGFVECWDEENSCQFPAFNYDRIWLVEELRIVEVDSMRLSQKPFAIIDKYTTYYLNKRAGNLDPSEFSDFTMFPSLAKSFSSFGDASSYLQKYLTGRCEVVILQQEA